MDNQKTSIFTKVINATESWLDATIEKNRNRKDPDQFLVHRVSLDKTEDNENNGSQGFYDKNKVLTFDHLTEIAFKDSVVSAIIQTRQNQVAGFSKFVTNRFEQGARIKLKDEKLAIDLVTELLDYKVPENQILKIVKAKNLVDNLSKLLKSLKTETLDIEEESEDEAIRNSWKNKRKAKRLLKSATKLRRTYLEEFITHCGSKDNRPFETKKWNFSTFNRAITRDSLIYNLHYHENVLDQAGNIHHFVPVDAATIRFASEEIKNYKESPTEVDYDIFNLAEPEYKRSKYHKDFELEDDKLANNEYKYVQIIKNVIERAFTEDELKCAIRNPVTNIYNNGYGLAELELLVSLITSHLNTEYYNIAYFTQGFSAKGILHIKTALPYREMEAFRQRWRAMITGNRNSFQTPILSGGEEVNWIPLTQNHSDIEFQGWLQYLIKMICAVYQIDPQEIGLGMREEGKGGGMSGDNTEQKISLSKNKGLYPFLTFLANYYNNNIIDHIDPDFELEFVGLTEETLKEALERQKRESEFKKTLNEIRDEDDLDPLPMGDDIILSDVYLKYYQQFSEAAQKQRDEAQQAQLSQDLLLNQKIENPTTPKNNVDKALKIEYYAIRDQDI